MTHEMIIRKLQDFHDGELSGPEKNEIESHLPGCDECREWIRTRQRMSEWITRSAPSASGVFVAEVMNRLEKLEGPVISTRRWALPEWLFPAFGYGFAVWLFLFVIAHREPMVTTESVLMADVPEHSRWAFAAEQAEVDNLLEYQGG